MRVFCKIAALLRKAWVGMSHRELRVRAPRGARSRRPGGRGPSAAGRFVTAAPASRPQGGWGTGGFEGTRKAGALRVPRAENKAPSGRQDGAQPPAHPPSRSRRDPLPLSVHSAGDMRVQLRTDRQIHRQTHRRAPGKVRHRALGPAGETGDAEAPTRPAHPEGRLLSESDLRSLSCSVQLSPDPLKHHFPRTCLSAFPRDARSLGSEK